MSIRPIFPVAALAGVLLAGCVASPGPAETSSPAPTSAPVEGFSVEALVAGVPAIDGTVLISVGDVEAAADLVDVPRPTGAGAELLEWLMATTGITVGDAVSLPWPSSLGYLRAAQHEDYIAATGFGIPDVDAFLEMSAPPTSFTILDGAFDTAAISSALGEPVEGIWAQPGEELAPQLGGPGVPDQLGRPVRVAGDAERIVVSLESDLVAAYLDDATGDWGDVRTAARILDEEGVYAAQIWRTGDAVVAVGLVAVEGGSVPVAVRIEAGHAAPEVGDSEGPVRVADVETRGDASVIHLEWTDEAAPAVAWQLLANRAGILVG